MEREESIILGQCMNNSIHILCALLSAGNITSKDIKTLYPEITIKLFEASKKLKKELEGGK